MRSIWMMFVSVILAWPPAANAIENFATSVTVPYSPGCITETSLLGAVPGSTNTITEGSIEVWNAFDILDLETINIRVWRKGCADPNRSILLVTLQFPDNGNGSPDAAYMPIFRARLDGVNHILRSSREANSSIANDGGATLPEGGEITLFLDGVSLLANEFDADLALSPDEYNGAFELLVLRPDLSGYTVDIPAYNDELQPTRIAINGRLTGLWVINGVVDQGIVISFSEFPNQLLGLVFLSWYTFDADGNLLWLTATGTYELGDTEVSLNVELVTQGEFMGNTPATRQSAGTIVLTGIACNNLNMQWNLSNIGLGSGTDRLQRPFSLETQGFACRDYQERIRTM